MDLPLALVGIALLSAEEAHRFLVVDVLRAIDDLDDFLQSANSVLAEQNMPDHRGLDPLPAAVSLGRLKGIS
jgi:hypothetical protein